jgi:hypothetical protein
VSLNNRMETVDDAICGAHDLVARTSTKMGSREMSAVSTGGYATEDKENSGTAGDVKKKKKKNRLQ